MSASAAILRTRVMMARHLARHIRRYVWIHVLAGIITILLVVGIGGAFFHFLFRFLVSQEPFGAPLMERLMGIVLLTFFSMLIFSNLIITLTTTYISRETEFLWGLPVQDRTIFAVKLTESIFFSSWAFVVLSLPLFASYGLVKHAPVWFYPAAFILGFPFLVIPASIGAVLTMVISAFLPARKARIFTIGILAASLGVTAFIVRFMGLRTMVLQTQDFSQIMELLSAGASPWLPSTWLANGLRAASQGQLADVLFWFFCLLATAMMAVQICLWLVPPLYYRGWTLSREKASPVAAARSYSVFTLLDWLLSVLPPPLKALLAKDVRTFWRDPAQWSQLVILFGLLVLYLANIRGVSAQMRGIEVFFRHWRVVLSLFNLGATAFVLSILTTRFVFPMLSLEGKQYWVIGLAPFPKQTLLWEKFLLCLTGCVATSVPLIMLSNEMLEVMTFMKWLGLVTVVALSVGLTSLAVGFGAIFPSFKEDNPARIANGFGGTITIVTSLFYVSGTLALLIPVTLAIAEAQHIGGASALRAALLASAPFLVACFALQGLTWYLPVAVGIRRWLSHEFHF
ncbi:MAG: putative ABC transporter permease subunit [Candidatus Sumerlaeaceae bacterium]